MVATAKHFKPPKETPYKPNSLKATLHLFKNLFFFYLRQLWQAVYHLFISLVFSGAERHAQSYYLNGNFAPVYEELDTWIHVEESEVQHRSLPSDFPAGMFIQNGPNPPYAPLGGQSAYHWFDGEGMLHAIEFSKDGKIRYANRFTKSDQYKNQRKFGKTLYFGLNFFGNPFLKALTRLQEWWYQLEPRKEGSANTSVQYFGGNLKALMEGAPPMNIELPSLRTIEQETFQGKYTNNFTAHPKIDPETKEVFFIGYGLQQSPDLRYGLVKPNGELDFVFSLVDAPYCCMIHDFVITKHYAIVFFFPLKVKVEALLVEGKPPFGCYSDEPTYIAVIPKYLGREAVIDQDQIQWFKAKGGYTFHFCNAFEEEDEITVHGCRMQNIKLFGARLEELEIENTTLYEWKINLQTGICKEQSLVLKNETTNTMSTVNAIDFPIIHHELIGRKNQFIWVGHINHQTVGAYDAVFKIDLLNNTVLKQPKTMEDMRFGEHFFVKKCKAKKEEDGYLVTFATNVKTYQSYLKICDAKTLEEVFMLKLPNRVPFGFHTSFIPEHQYL